MAELLEFSALNNLGLLAITETWLSEEILDSEVTIPRMQLFRTDRRNRKGGGTAIYISEEIKASLVTDPVLISVPESTWLRIHCPIRDTLVGVVYRPPAPPNLYDSALVEAIRKLDHYQHMQIVLMGDFNIPGTSSSAHCSELLHAEFLAVGLQELVQGPIRRAPDGSCSALDLCAI